jgi:predicted RNA-binding protein YlqC (UPF0109 family)
MKKETVEKVVEYVPHEVRAWAIREGHVIGRRGQIAQKIKDAYASRKKK